MNHNKQRRVRIPVTIPTATLIIFDKQNPYRVILFESGAKWQGRLVVPGGKKSIEHTLPETALLEADQEVGLQGGRIEHLHFLFVNDTPGRDVRTVTTDKLMEDIGGRGDLEQTEFEGHYSLDVWYAIGTDQQVFTPDNKESVRVFWQDLQQLTDADQDRFILDHFSRLMLYREKYAHTLA
jgi:ADP-ribose pyrophosphatase YjhB (NUDIX family)